MRRRRTRRLHRSRRSGDRRRRGARGTRRSAGRNGRRLGRHRRRPDGKRRRRRSSARGIRRLRRWEHRSPPRIVRSTRCNRSGLRWENGNAVGIIEKPGATIESGGENIGVRGEGTDRRGGVEGGRGQRTRLFAGIESEGPGKRRNAQRKNEMPREKTKCPEKKRSRRQWRGNGWRKGCRPERREGQPSWRRPSPCRASA